MSESTPTAPNTLNQRLVQWDVNAIHAICAEISKKGKKTGDPGLEQYTYKNWNSGRGKTSLNYTGQNYRGEKAGITVSKTLEYKIEGDKIILTFRDVLGRHETKITVEDGKITMEKDGQKDIGEDEITDIVQGEINTFISAAREEFGLLDIAETVYKVRGGVDEALKQS